MSIKGKDRKVTTDSISDVEKLGWSKDRIKELTIYSYLWEELAQTASAALPSRPTDHTRGYTLVMRVITCRNINTVSLNLTKLLDLVGLLSVT